MGYLRSLLNGFKINNFFDKPQLSKMFSFGLPVSLSGILFWGLEGVDKLMLKYYSTYEELGLYSVTLSVAAFAGVLTNIFTTVWVPVVYKWISENINLEKIDEVITHIIIGGTCLVSLTGLFSWILKYLLPESYSNIHYLLPLCMLWPIFYAISEASGVGIAVSRKTKFSLIVSVVSLGVNVGLNMLLIPSLGAKGAAISLAVSFWFFLVLRTEFSAKLWRGSNKRSLFFWSTLLLLTSIVYGVLGSTIGLFSHLLWLILLGLMVYSFPNYFLLYRNKALQFINKLLSLSAKK
jgi:O-antigen/teichoic acid export membrane protein